MHPKASPATYRDATLPADRGSSRGNLMHDTSLATPPHHHRTDWEQHAKWDKQLANKPLSNGERVP